MPEHAEHVRVILTKRDSGLLSAETLSSQSFLNNMSLRAKRCNLIVNHTLKKIASFHSQ
jgi:hypothetical protein